MQGTGHARITDVGPFIKAGSERFFILVYNDPANLT